MSQYRKIIQSILKYKEENRNMAIEELAEESGLEEEVVEAVIWDFMSTVRGYDTIKKEIESIKNHREG